MISAAVMRLGAVLSAAVIAGRLVMPASTPPSTPAPPTFDEQWQDVPPVQAIEVPPMVKKVKTETIRLGVRPRPPEDLVPPQRIEPVRPVRGVATPARVEPRPKVKTTSRRGDICARHNMRKVQIGRRWRCKR